MQIYWGVSPSGNSRVWKICSNKKCKCIDMCSILIFRCMHKHNDTIKTSDTVHRKIYLLFYLKGFCVKGSWRPNWTATYWPPHSYGHQPFLSHSSGCCSTGGPGAQLSDECWLSLPHLVSKTLRSPNCSIGGPEGSFYRVLAFSTTPCLQLSDLQTNWLPVFTELYNS